MEAAIRWSPLSTDDSSRFLLADVAGNALTLCQIDALKKGQLRYTPLAHRDRLPNFTAFDWSKTDDSLVALGLSSGEASVLKIYPEQPNAESARKFEIKTQRKCNTITFSSDNWLAVGLDRVRNDHCLAVYDLNNKDRTEPLSKLCLSEAVTSVRFFPSHPLELLAAVNRSTIRLYDLRDSHTSTAGVGTFGPTKLVNNIAIDPLDENYFASGGSTADPCVTVWDKRFLNRSAGTPGPEGASSAAVLELRPAVDNSQTTSIWSVRFSGLKRGRFCLLSSFGELKVYDTSQHQLTSPSVPPPPNPYGGASWNSQHYVSRTHNLREPHHNTQPQRDAAPKVIAFDWLSTGDSNGQSMLTLHADRRVDLTHVPNPALLSMTARNDLALCREDVLVFEPSVRRAKVSEEIALMNGEKEQQVQIIDQTPPPGFTERVKPLDQQSLRVLNGSITTAAARTEKWLDDGVGSMPAIVRQEDFADSLALLTVPRRRCQEGYLMDCKRNVKIVADDPTLVKLWITIGRLEDLAGNEGMVSESLDLSYLGVNAIWQGTVGKSSNRILETRSSIPQRFEDAVVGILDKQDLPPFEGAESEKPHQRQLCLAICGASFRLEDVKEKCDMMKDDGQYYKAIAIAMVYGYKNLALGILRVLIRGKIIPNIGLGALIASDGLNSEQKEMCSWLEEDATDAYLQAILLYLGTGRWIYVVNKMELELDLSDRLIIALIHLDDKQITTLLERLTRLFTIAGNTEGVLLTGLTAEAMDLFQSYIRKTNDLQTAVLATAFTNPRYVDDVRWDMWKETYFLQMQSWRTFIERTKFTMQHNRKSATHKNQILVKTPPRQLTLRCAHCQGSLAKHIESDQTQQQQQHGHHNQQHHHNNSHSSPTRPGGGGGGGPLPPPPAAAAAAAAEAATRTRNTGPATSTGTICPRCGRHLPRCALCMQWLGTPEPLRVKRPLNNYHHHHHQQQNSFGYADNAAATGPTSLDLLSEKEAGGGGDADVMAGFVTFCASCTHGFHAHHARTWFAKHAMCPVPDCRCLCGLRG
ncbi:hypothetical protein AAFC00_004681 [Neodothiora populina]|uniref:WD repeat protein mio zinc-ribbon like domain-containing protein n=1 Tax=Neodothiora populina TaxID=2781224 RepID=A0ABR3P310_9PEZI